MSDVLPEAEPPFDLPRPEPPLTWSERLSVWAESLDLTPTRLVVGVVVLAVGGFLAWRLLAPPALPPEMELPFASTSVAPASASAEGGAAAGGGGAPSEGAPGGGAPVVGGRPEEVVVHVAGAVQAPGVQQLPGDARVVDAVEAAGGATADADLARINLAALLEDGQQVYVPRLGEVVPAAPAGGGGAASGGAGGPAAAPGSGAAGGAAGGLVNINQATLDELDELPGVGPAIAQAIIDHREQQGPFTSVDQLLDVRGIGDAKLADLRDLVTV